MEAFSDEFKSEIQNIGIIFGKDNIQISFSNEMASLEIMINIDNKNIFRINIKIPPKYPTESPKDFNFVFFEEFPSLKKKNVMKKVNKLLFNHSGEVVLFELIDTLNDVYNNAIIEREKERKEKEQIDLEEKKRKEMEAIKLSYEEEFERKRREYQESLYNGKNGTLNFDYTPSSPKPNSPTPTSTTSQKDIKGLFSYLEEVDFNPAIRQSRITIEEYNFNTSSENNGVFVYTPYSLSKMVNSKVDSSLSESNFFAINRASEDTINKVFNLFDYSVEGCYKKQFIFGGRNLSTISSDFVRLDFEKGTIDIFRNLHQLNQVVEIKNSYVTIKELGEIFSDEIEENEDTNHEILALPKSYGHQMVFLGDGILILTPFKNDQEMQKSTKRKKSKDEKMQAYFVSISKTGQLHCGMFISKNDKKKEIYEHPNIKNTAKSLPRILNFNALAFSQNVIIFGGELDGKYQNCVYIIERKRNVLEVIYQSNLDDPNETIIPSARINSGAIEINGSFYIYGGKKEDGSFLNDLWAFNIEKRQWKEIILNCAAPRVGGFAIWRNNDGFSIMCGGATTSEEMKSVSLTSFDTKENKFYILEPINSPLKLNSLYDREFVKVKPTENQFLVFGGKNPKDGSVIKSTSSFILSNAYDSGVPFDLLDFILNERKQKNFTDITFRFKLENENEILETEAHSYIIECRCPALMKEIDKFGELNDKKKIIFNITEFSCEVFECFLNFLYSGKLFWKKSFNNNNYNNTFEVARIFEKYSPNKLFPVVKRILKGESFDFFIQKNIFEGIREDFGDLLKENKLLKSDLNLVFKDETKLQTHRLFLCRSPYFSKMLKSSFKESIESEIDFTSFDKNSVLLILEYLYTDRIRIDESTCISMLIYSLQFGLLSIANVARKYLSNQLTLQNAIQILNLADFYQDSVTLNICVRFVAENYSKFHFSKDLQIDENVMRQINEAHLKLQKQKK